MSVSKSSCWSDPTASTWCEFRAWWKFSRSVCSRAGQPLHRPPYEEYLLIFQNIYIMWTLKRVHPPPLPPPPSWDLIDFVRRAFQSFQPGVFFFCLNGPMNRALWRRYTLLHKRLHYCSSDGELMDITTYCRGRPGPQNQGRRCNMDHFFCHQIPSENSFIV